jgi:hypothetical protein
LIDIAFLLQLSFENDVCDRRAKNLALGYGQAVPVVGNAELTARGRSAQGNDRQANEGRSFEYFGLTAGKSESESSNAEEERD